MSTPGAFIRVNTVVVRLHKDVHRYLNTYHAAGECRRQVKDLRNVVKNVKIVEFHYHFWNHHEKCIQMSTNMPSIGLVIPEITCQMLVFENFEKTNTILLRKTNASRGKC